METTPITSASQITQPSALSASTADMGKAEFLQLLVAQLQNQDPLSPMANEDFAAQLAQFSSLEELTKMNSSMLDSMDLDMLQTSSFNNALAANFIGKQVDSYGDTVSLISGEANTLNFVLDDYAAKITVKIHDETGTLIRTIDAASFESGKQSIDWDGKNMHDEFLDGGNYRFEVIAEDAQGESVNAAEITKGIVSSVRYVNGMAVLLVNGEEISLSNVLEIG